MSRIRAIQALKLEKTDKVASMEWCTGLSAEQIHALTGIDPLSRYYESMLRLIEILEIDIHGPLPFMEQLSISCPRTNDDKCDHRQQDWGLIKGTQVQDGARQELVFRCVDDVLRFSPLEWDVKTEEDYFEEFSTFHNRNVSLYEGRCVAEEDIYTTLFHWCIDLFGWENFMVAASTDEKRFNEILLEFKELSIRRAKAWARVKNLDFFMCHDDICMTSGPVFSPDWYRKYIFPHYQDIMAPLKKAGIPVIFISDGCYMSLVNDLAYCGWDGYVFDHTNDFAKMVEMFGNKKILIGGPDIRILTFESPQNVREHVRRILEIAKGIRGYFYATAGSLTENIPMENIKTYIQASKQYRCAV